MVEYLKFGYDLIEKVQDNTKTRDAFKEQLLREVRYNKEIMHDFINLTPEKRKLYHREYIDVLETNIYDTINANFVPMHSLIEINNINLKDYIDIDKEEQGFIKSIESINTTQELIEKLYLKIKLLKATARLKDYTKITKYSNINKFARLLEKVVQGKNK